MGRFDFADDEMDTCIAIRTMTFKDGIAYLQAGGGIVFDSVEEDEYVETLNKLKGNMRALDVAEGMLTNVPDVTLSVIDHLHTLQNIGTTSKMRRVYRRHDVLEDMV